MKTYLNQDDRKTVLMLVGFLNVFEEAESKKHFPELFGKDRWSDLKRAKAFLRKALDGLADRIGYDQAKKIVNMSRTHDLALVGKAAPKDESTFVLTEDQLFDIAEFAIGHNCTSCTKQDYKSCRLFQVLDEVDIPPAETKTTNDCPYRQ